MASSAKKVAARPLWSRKNRSGEWAFGDASPGPGGYNLLPDCGCHDLLLVGHAYSSAFPATVSSNRRIAKNFGNITSGEDGSSAARLWNGENSSSVNVLIASCTSRHYFGTAFFLGLRCRVANYQALDSPRKVITAGGHQLAGVARGLLRDNVVEGDKAQRLV